MNDPKLSIIIPVLDDSFVLHRLIEQLSTQSLEGMEIIVADGGSKDGSESLARKLGVRVVVSDPGRGRQMNAASREARGQQLLFLHADSHLPHTRFLEDAFSFMAPILSAQPRTAGHFSLRFVDPPRGRRWIMKFWEEKTRFNRPECIHGDQGLWISRLFFAETGGFDTTYPFLEERQVVQEVARLGQWVVLPGRLGTSARRFCTEGVARRTLLNALIMVCHALGWHEFLQQAPGIYRQQNTVTNLQGMMPRQREESEPLGLRPKPRWKGETPSQTHPIDQESVNTMASFFRLLQTLDHAQSPEQRRVRWRATGRILRQSLWQVALFVDVMLWRPCFPRGFPFLALHTNFFEPVLHRMFPDTLAGRCAWLLFHGLRLFFQWSQRHP